MSEVSEWVSKKLSGQVAKMRNEASADLPHAKCGVAENVHHGMAKVLHFGHV